MFVIIVKWFLILTEKHTVRQLIALVVLNTVKSTRRTVYTSTTRTFCIPVIGTTGRGTAIAVQNWLAAVVLLGGSEPHASAARILPERWHLMARTSSYCCWLINVIIDPPRLRFLLIESREYTVIYTYTLLVLLLYTYKLRGTETTRAHLLLREHEVLFELVGMLAHDVQRELLHFRVGRHEGTVGRRALTRAARALQHVLFVRADLHLHAAVVARDRNGAQQPAHRFVLYEYMPINIK